MCVLALLVAGCENSSDNNRGLTFDTLEVNFEGSLPNGSWQPGTEIGLFASCTRNDTRSTPMSVNEHAKYTAADAGESARLRSVSDDDRITALAADHNFQFYAYHPYSDAPGDMRAIPAQVPARQSYAEGRDRGFYTASKRATTVVPTVELAFSNIFSTLELYLPDDLLDEEGNSVIRRMAIEPAEEANFSGALAVSGTYDLTTGSFTDTPESRAQRIEVDFGEQGLLLNRDYTNVPVVVAPFTVPEGGLKLTFADLENKESSTTILSRSEDAGTVLAAGEVMRQYLSASDDGIIPVAFPVVFPLGYENGRPVFSSTTQPRWLEEGIWVCPSQPQAYAEWHKESDPSDRYVQKLEYVASNIGSPGIKGIWTGDGFEFTLPVRKFAAGTSVTVTFPMYTRQGPVFWLIEYLDGGEWKCNKEPMTCYDPDYTREATFTLIRGGRVIEHTMRFENAVASGHLKFRIRCADGSVQADSDTKVAVRETPWVSGTAYGAPFYLYLAGSDVKSVTFSVN